MGFNSGFKGLLLYIEDTFPFPLGHEQNVHLEGHAIYCSIESPFTIPISLSSASSATSSFPYTLNDLHILRHFLRVTFIDPSKRASCQHPSTPFPTLPPWRQRKQILPKCWLSIYQKSHSKGSYSSYWQPSGSRTYTHYCFNVAVRPRLCDQSDEGRNFLR